MIISDLEHLEVVSKKANLVGGYSKRSDASADAWAKGQKTEAYTETYTNAYTNPWNRHR